MRRGEAQRQCLFPESANRRDYITPNASPDLRLQIKATQALHLTKRCVCHRYLVAYCFMGHIFRGLLTWTLAYRRWLARVRFAHQTLQIVL